MNISLLFIYILYLIGGFLVSWLVEDDRISVILFWPIYILMLGILSTIFYAVDKISFYKERKNGNTDK